MFTSLINFLLIAVQAVIGYHLISPLLLYIFYLLKNKKRSLSPPRQNEADYAVIITAYEQTHTIPAAVNSILESDYSNYLIYVVADKCDISSLKFDDERVILLRPEETLANNIKSHFHAIRNFKREHERITIIDSDNLAHPQYFHELDVFFNAGYQAVQGIREAKNLDTAYSRLDAARDIYYHFYDGKILFGLGSSAALAGSGMAFTTDLYRSCLENKEISGAGFDKVLQAEILKRNLRIAFAEKAVVYDEKTSKPDQLVNQRSRWINTWFKYFKYGFGLTFTGVKNRSLNQLLFGLMLLRPPLFIFLILSFLCLAVNAFAAPAAALVWLGGFGCFILGFALAILKSNTDKRIIQSLVNIPKFMFYQVISLRYAKNADKRSVATKHSYIETEAPKMNTMR